MAACWEVSICLGVLLFDLLRCGIARIEVLARNDGDPRVEPAGDHAEQVELLVRAADGDGGEVELPLRGIGPVAVDLHHRLAVDGAEGVLGGSRAHRGEWDVHQRGDGHEGDQQDTGKRHRRDTAGHGCQGR